MADLAASTATAAQPQTLVCVLGMHRSGTSVATRLLNLLGLSLGSEEQLLNADEFNERGYWEQKPIRDLNDEILRRFGGTWRDPPAFPPRWWASPDQDDLRGRARALIDDQFGDAPLAAWKDPRTCLTLPIWRTVATPTHYVICIRNPKEVARSLQHAMPVEAGTNLWLKYVRGSLVHSDPAKRHFLFYDELMADPMTQFRRLAAFIGRGRAAGRKGVRQAAEEFVTSDLHHHRSEFVEVVWDRGIAFPAKALYTVIRLHAAHKPAMQPERLLEAFSRAAVEAADATGVPSEASTAPETAPRTLCH